MKNSKNIEEVVKDSYEKNNYLQEYRNRDLTNFEKMQLQKILALIPEKARILDLGCGSGKPFDYYLIEQDCFLTGIDFCEKHIEHAKRNNPKGDYFCMSIKEYKSNEKFDLVIALYSIFHIQREDHLEVYKNIHSLLKNNGIFLVTIRDEEEEVIDDDNFYGANMLWSYYGYDKNIEMLNEIGFDVISSEDEINYGSEEQHKWVILKKI